MRLVRLARNIVFDLRYGAFLGGVIPTRYLGTGAVNVANSDYAVLPHLFDRLIEHDDVLVDVGCGKGRVLNWWLRFYPHHRIVGIELDGEVAEKTRHRLRRHSQFDRMVMRIATSGRNTPSCRACSILSFRAPP